MQFIPLPSNWLNLHPCPCPNYKGEVRWLWSCWQIQYLQLLLILYLVSLNKSVTHRYPLDRTLWSKELSWLKYNSDPLPFKARLYLKWHAPLWDVALIGRSKSKISNSLLEKWSGASPNLTTWGLIFYYVSLNRKLVLCHFIFWTKSLKVWI